MSFEALGGCIFSQKEGEDHFFGNEYFESNILHVINSNI